MRAKRIFNILFVIILFSCYLYSAAVDIYTGNTLTSPEFVKISDGSLVVFFNHGKLVAKKSTDSGATWTDFEGTGGVVSTITAGTYERISASVDGSDNIYLIYHRSDYNSSAILHKKLTRSGGTWTIGSEYTVDSTSLDRRCNPGIAVKEDGSTIWCAYMVENPNSTNVNVKIRQSTDNGVNWSDVSGLTDGILSGTNRTGYVSASLIWKNNKLWAMHVINSSYRTWTLTDGWSSETATGLNNGGFGSCYFGAVTSNNNYVHTAGFVSNSTYKHTYFNGTAWSSAVTIGNPNYGVISGKLITAGENLWFLRCDTANGDGAGYVSNVIYKKCTYTAGPTYTWDASYTSLTADGLNKNLKTLNTIEPNLTYIPYIYISGTTNPTTAPYYLRFNKIDLSIMVTGISPVTASNLAAQTVTITGTGFFGGGSSSDIVSVKFDDTAATALTTAGAVITDTSITGAIVPPGIRIGTYNVKVTTGAYGVNPYSVQKFTVTTSVAAVTNVNPSDAYNTSAATITVLGTGFYSGTNTNDVTSIKLNSTPETVISSYSVASSSSITGLVIPANIEAGTYGLIVSTSAGTSVTTANSLFEVKTNAPVVTNVSPAVGPNNGSTIVTIYGTGFFGGMLSGNVKEMKLSDGTPITGGTVVNDSTISGAAVPSGISAGTYDVLVRNAGGINSTSTVKFVVVAGPVVSTVTPATGSNLAAHTITITGSNFHSGGTSVVSFVRLNDNLNTALSGYTVPSDTEILGAVIPSGVRAGTWDVQVTTNVGTNSTSGNKFTLSGDIPTVTGSTPAFNYTNLTTTISIYGTKFYGGTNTGDVKTITIYNSGATISSYSVSSDTSIINAVVPAGITVGTYDIRVATYAGENSTSTNKFIVYPPLPVVNVVSPNVIANNVISTLSISGFNFYGGTGSNVVQTLTLSGPVSQSIGFYDANSDTSIINAIVPAGLSPGTFDVLVGTTVGTNASSAMKLRITSNPPVVSTFTPASIYNNSANTIGITGLNFFAGTDSSSVVKVELSGPETVSILSGFSAVSDSQINTVIVPSGKLCGSYSVLVYTNEGSGVSSGKITINTLPPAVTGITPDKWVNTSPMDVTIYGSGFFGGTGLIAVSGISLDDANNTSISTYVVDNDTSIRLVMPQNIMSGSYNIQITTTGGTNLTSAVNFKSLIDKNDTNTQSITNGIVQIGISPGTFDTDTAVVVSTNVANPLVGSANSIKYTGIKILQAFNTSVREISLVPAANFAAGKKINVSFSYTASIDDPVIERNYRILWLNNGRWEIVSGSQTVNTVLNIINCELDHFSIFRIGQFIQVSSDLSNVVVYPNPVDFGTSAGNTLKFVNLTADPTLRIFTLSGEPVKEFLPDLAGNLGNDGRIEWDGINDTGSLITRGLYIYMMTDEAGNRKAGKFAVK